MECILFWIVIESPFKILRPFEQKLVVAIFKKDDDIQSDRQAADMLGASKAAGLHQMHGNRVIVVRDALDRTEQADGMITDVPGLALCIRAADCQNFVIVEPEHGVMGVLHVGWRGLIHGAIASFFDILKREWGIEPSSVYVGAGPSLCMQCADFTDPGKELFPLPSRFIHGKHADLRAAATAQLQDLGVPPGRIERLPDCTRCHPQIYWTYRGGHREHVKAGHTNVLAAMLRAS